jgi:ATPase family protein associated with various cellular activities (AAA)/winged helix domain-containing protein
MDDRSAEAFALQDRSALARRHLLLRLRAINRALGRAVATQASAAARISRPDLNALCVTDEQVTALLDAVNAPDDESGDDAGQAGTPGEIEQAEQAEEDALRRASFDRLPFDLLVRTLALSPFEQDAVLICAAAEVDRRYERIFAYVLDDLERRRPSVELLCLLTAQSAEQRLARRHEAGRFGRLRRIGLLLPIGEAGSELRQELRIAPTLLEWLLTGEGDPAAFVDPAEIAVRGDDHPPGIAADVLAHLITAMCSGEVTVAGLFGPRGAGHDACARAVAAGVGRPLRRLAVDSEAALENGLAAAAALGAILWLDVDPLTEAGNERMSELVAARLAVRRMPLLLSGVHPWRPADLLASRAYVEIEIAPPDTAARIAMWAAALPEMSEPRRTDLALRFHMSGAEVAAVAGVARATARVRGNGTPLPIDGVVDEACVTVSRRRSDHFAAAVRPRRSPADLVLAPDLHRQVLEVARFFRALPRVSDTWRFGRMHGRGGLKVLFSGDSGTGKTLAAEVVATELALPLLKIDLARVVSKWVGETEKNLETAFREAEESHSILFFDEADALFGKRGEVSHGVDRYANLEVSYLLQRLEEHPGLVILASNLRDEIDEAFVRRFHVILHFPRPSVDERARIWRLALPPEAPLGADVNVAALARLDLTGAGIVGTARTAALLAADEGAAAILMRHFVHAARRQFAREARLLTGADLGPYATLLPGP